MSNRTSLFRCSVLSLASFAAAAGAPPPPDPVVVWGVLLQGSVRAAGAKNYTSAEELIQKALQAATQLPDGDARIGTTLNAQGLIYREEKKYPEAERAFEKALVIFENAYGADSLDTGNVNFNIAAVMMAQAHYEAAEPYITRSHTTYVRILGAQSLKAASTLCMAGEAARYQKKYQAAEAPLKQCADAREAAEGIESPAFGDALYSLGQVYTQESRFALADSTLKLVEKIREHTLGVTSPEFADALEAHAAVLRAMKRDPEATLEEEMAAAIRRVGKKFK